MAQKFKFKIENDTHEWGEQFITGAQVRAVPPGIPDNMDLYIKLHGKAGKLVVNTDSFDLSDKGIEKFYAQDASSEAGRR